MEMRSEKSEVEDVVCGGCGRTKKVVRGHLTEEGKRHFRCYPCSQNPVLENAVQERRVEGKQLLVEG